MNKAYYFKVGRHNVRLAMPENPLSRILAFVFATMFIVDLMSGHIFGAVLMFLFTALQVTDIN